MAVASRALMPEPLNALGDAGARRLWSLVSGVLNRDEMEVEAVLTEFGLLVCEALSGGAMWMALEKDSDTFEATRGSRGLALWCESEATWIRVRKRTAARESGGTPRSTFGDLGAGR